MHKVFVVAWREFFETIKTRAFFFSVVIMPALILGLIYLSVWLTTRARNEVSPLRTVVVIDQTGELTAELANAVAMHNQSRPNQPFEIRVAKDQESEEALRAQVQRGEIYAYALVPEGALAITTPDQSPTTRLARRDSQVEAGRIVRNLLNTAVTAVRFRQESPDLSLSRVRALQEGLNVQEVDVRSGEASGENEFTRVLTPFIFMFLLFTGTTQISFSLLTSVIEEKNSRVMEVLLSAVSPMQLMAGKILGIVLVGIVLMAVWGLVGAIGANTRGAGAGIVTPYRLFYMAMYFIPAFLMFASLLAGIGSACNTLKEAQSMAFPLTIFTIIPLMVWFPITENPHSALSVGLSYFPPVTPFIMVLRICADPDLPLWQIITTLLLLWASVAAAIWVAAKIFRVGVLMHGKPPTPRELLRWVRYT